MQKHVIATNKYNKKTYDFMRLFVKKGELARLKEIAKNQGKSLNKFVTDAVYKEIETIK
jgi:predicted HicB family RNase H-like nuclease